MNAAKTETIPAPKKIPTPHQRCDNPTENHEYPKTKNKNQRHHQGQVQKNTPSFTAQRTPLELTLNLKIISTMKNTSINSPTQNKHSSASSGFLLFLPMLFRLFLRFEDSFISSNSIIASCLIGHSTGSGSLAANTALNIIAFILIIKLVCFFSR